MGHQHDRGALVAQLVEEAEDLLQGAQVHAAGRLVEDHERGLGHHGTGQQEALLLAAGELADGAAGH
ncbi:MAG TPA: hypothetical protein VKA65_17815, partial [Acidimicrobiales bacterium]|nr:hypothetical protein [Acidimicrobiales bacterium]